MKYILSTSRALSTIRGPYPSRPTRVIKKKSKLMSFLFRSLFIFIVFHQITMVLKSFHLENVYYHVSHSYLLITWDFKVVAVGHVVNLTRLLTTVIPSCLVSKAMTRSCLNNRIAG